MLGEPGFDLPKIVVLIVAVILIAVGASYRGTAALAGRAALGAQRLRPRRQRKQAIAEPDHGPFKPPSQRRLLAGRPNPLHLKRLGLVTWEAAEREKIEAAYEKVRSALMRSLADMEPASAEARGLRDDLRRAAEARESLLGRLE